jgi:hypothetical protein
MYSTKIIQNNLRASSKLAQQKSMQEKFSKTKIKLNFGSSSNLISATENLTGKSGLSKRAGFFINNLLKNGVGQNTSNFINYSGKALLTPLMILTAAQFTNEKKSSVKCQMAIEPLEALTVFSSVAGASLLVNKELDKQAKKGTLGNFMDKRLGNFFDVVKNPAGKQNLIQLKILSTIGLTFLAIPITSLIVNWILPKIIKKVHPNAPSRRGHSMYSHRFSSVYASNLNPGFGKLTAHNIRDRRQYDQSH